MKKMDKQINAAAKETEKKLQSYTPPRVIRMTPVTEGLGQCAPGSGYVNWQGCQENGNTASYGCWGLGNNAGNNCWGSGNSPGDYCFYPGNSDT
jgi:hypothetical protein